MVSRGRFPFRGQTQCILLILDWSSFTGVSFRVIPFIILNTDMSVFSSACSCTPVIWKLSIMQDFFQDNAFWHHYNQTQTWFDLYPFVASIVKVMVITIFQLYFCPFRKSDIKQEMFQKHVCRPWCKIQVYLLCRSKTCTKQVTKGLKYIKWTTHWAQKSSLTLTFEHVTWKSIGII